MCFFCFGPLMSNVTHLNMEGHHGDWVRGPIVDYNLTGAYGLDPVGTLG